MGHGSRSDSTVGGYTDVAANPLGHSPSIEIHDQADAKSAHAQVCEQLRFMNRQDGRNRLDLKNDLARDNDVGPEPLPYPRVLVDDRNSNLSLEGNVGLSQLMAQALLVERLQQARPCMPVHLDGQPDHLFGQVTGYQHEHRLPWPTAALPSSSVVKSNKA